MVFLPFTLRVLVSLGVACSALSSAFVMPRPLGSHHTALHGFRDYAENDGGTMPCKEEIKVIESVMSNVVVDNKPLRHKVGLHIVRAGVDRLFFRGDNTAINAVLANVRANTKAQYMHIDEINFSDKVQKTLFYETTASLLSDGLVGASLGVMKWTPYMEPEEGEIDYDSLYGDKFLPYDRMMISDDAEHCFLCQTEAFCSPETAGSDRLVCDLNYLQKYQVKRGTLARYGGHAVVQRGNTNSIAEINGIKAGAPGFEKAKAVFLSSFAVHLIVVRHAVMTHLAISQRLLMKLTTKPSHAANWTQYQDAWKKDDGASVLLRALTTRTNEVSINLQLLIGGDRSLVGRATSLTDSSLVQLGYDMYNAYSDMTPDALIANVADEGMGMWTNAVNAAWQAAQECVNEICKDVVKGEFVNQEDLTDAALMLWVATFYHSFIGDFQLNNVNKGMLPLLLTGEPHVHNLSYGTLSTTIGVSTMTRTVNIETLEGFFPHASQREAWEKYVLTLRGLQTGVEGFDYNAPVYAAVNF